MGEGCDLLLIDDPTKSREEADSEAYRERAWEWYSEDLYTRLEPGSQVLLIATRWREDDLPGMILASDDGPNWTVVNLPALAEDNDPLGRQPGQALCPERYDETRLARIEKTLGWAFQPLYQQRAIAKEGGLFKRGYFKTRQDEPPAGLRLVRYWDTAGTADGGCYTVGVLMGRHPSGMFYVLDVERAQLAGPDRENLIKATAEDDRSRYGERYGNVEIHVERQGGSSGKESVQDTVANLAGFDVQADLVNRKGNKEERAVPFARQCQADKVVLIRGAWNAAYVDELCAFPKGKYADQVDASSGAFNILAAPVPNMDVRQLKLATVPGEEDMSYTTQPKFPHIRYFGPHGTFQATPTLDGQKHWGPEFKSQSEAAYAVCCFHEQLGYTVPDWDLRFDPDPRVATEKKKAVEDAVKRFIAEHRLTKNPHAVPTPPLPGSDKGGKVKEPATPGAK